MTTNALFGLGALLRGTGQRWGTAVSEGWNLNSGFCQILGHHTDELPKVWVAGRIDRDAAKEVEFPDEEPRRLQVPKRSGARRTAPRPDNPKTAASYPIAAHVDDESVFSAGDDERAEHLPAVAES